MSPLLRVTICILAIVFLSTSFYVYNFNKAGSLLGYTSATPPPTPSHPTEYTPPKIKKNYMCNVAVAIYTTPNHATTRVKDAQASWTKRICPYGKAQYMFIGLPAEAQVQPSTDVPCGTDYYSLCCKSMEGLAKLYAAYPNADWYYKVDDDTILVPHNVDEMLAQHDPNDKLMLGWAIEAVVDSDDKEFHGQIREPMRNQEYGQIYPDSIFYCSGSGYVMSGALVRGMMQNMTHYKEVWEPICDLYDAEDVAVGLFVAKFGGRIQKIQGVFNGGWNWDDGPKDDQQEIVSVHLSRSTAKMVYFDRLLSGVVPQPHQSKKRNFQMVYEN